MEVMTLDFGEDIVKTTKDALVEKVNLSKMPEKIKRELEEKLALTYFKTIDIDLIDDVRIDLREAREIYSAGVIKSCEDINLIDVSPIIVMARNDGKFELVDGQTRFNSYKGMINRIPCLVIPELTSTAATSLNTILNSKRKNLSEKEQRVMFTELENDGFSVEEIAEMSGYKTKRVNTQRTIEDHGSDGTKEAIDKGMYSARKVEVSTMPLLLDAKNKAEGKPYSGISIEKNMAIQDAVVETVNHLNANRQPGDEEITRDSMAVSETARILYRNSVVMHKDYSAKQIVESSFIKSGQSDFICEHPDKVEVLKEILIKGGYKSFICLCCEGPVLFDKDGNKVDAPIKVAADIIGKDNVFGVGYFEGAKLDDMEKEGIPHYQGDMFEWLEQTSGSLTEGLIFIDSNGSLDFYSMNLIRKLQAVFPNCTIVLLALDIYSNQRCYKNIARDFMTAWGVDRADNIEDVMINLGDRIGQYFLKVWKEEDKSGQTISMWRIV